MLVAMAGRVIAYVNCSKGLKTMNIHAFQSSANAVDDTRRTPEVVIVGAGMSGVLAAIELRKAGIDSFTIYEKASSVGGTWRDNTYPGLSCDVPAHMYTYSFETNPDYSHRFAMGPEIQQYFERVAEQYDVLSKIKFNQELVSAKYLNNRWQLRTKDGQEIVADIVVCASGVLHHPEYPEIEGLESFAGTQFHTARWDHTIDLSDKKVGIIGTGSTSVQVVPAIVDKVGHLSVFQRTPQWIMPLAQRTYSNRVKDRLRRNPKLARRLRNIYSWVFERTFAKAVIGAKLPQALVGLSCRHHLKSKVKNQKLRETLTPDYQPMCKRIIIGNGFYEAIQEPQTSLVTDSIERIEPGGVRTEDGTLHDLDVLILATGFKAHNFMRPMEMVGESGLTIEQAWENGAQAHRSIAIPGFPNFFMLIGPNSPIGNYSLISIAELQVNYILQLINLWRDQKCDEIEPKRVAADQYNEALKEAMGGTVWVTGCQSWYLDKNGNPAMWPWSYDRFRQDMAAPVLEEFELKRAGSNSAGAA